MRSPRAMRASSSWPVQPAPVATRRLTRPTHTSSASAASKYPSRGFSITTKPQQRPSGHNARTEQRSPLLTEEPDLGRPPQRPGEVLPLFRAARNLEDAARGDLLGLRRADP